MPILDARHDFAHPVEGDTAWSESYYFNAYCPVADAGLFTRIIAIPFIVEMVVAILTTKVALYLGTSPLPLPPALPKVGFWAVMHETRSDYAQILTSIFLLVVGPGSWSLDALRRRRADALIARKPSEQMQRLPALDLARKG